MENKQKKVVKGLERCLGEGCDGCEYEYGGAVTLEYCKEDLMRDALALLKAQEAVEPVVDIDTWKCGNCGHTLEHQELLGDNVLFHEQYNFCPECGQAVKWE